MRNSPASPRRWQVSADFQGSGTTSTVVLSSLAGPVMLHWLGLDIPSEFVGSGQRRGAVYGADTGDSAARKQPASAPISGQGAWRAGVRLAQGGGCRWASGSDGDAGEGRAGGAEQHFRHGAGIGCGGAGGCQPAGAFHRRYRADTRAWDVERANRAARRLDGGFQRAGARFTVGQTAKCRNASTRRGDGARRDALPRAAAVRRAAMGGEPEFPAARSGSRARRRICLASPLPAPARATRCCAGRAGREGSR